MTRGVQLLVVGLVVLVALPGAAAAQPSDTTVDDACDEQDPQTTLVWVEGNDAATNSSVTVYPGTRIHVAFCGENSDDVSNWGLASVSGLDDIEDNGNLFSATVTEDAEEILIDDSVIEQKDPENTITITVQQGPQVQSNLTDSTLLFRSDMATAYRNREGAYLSSAAELNATVGQLDNTTTTLNGTSGVPSVEELDAANDTLVAMRTDQRATATDAGELRALLYDNVTGVEGAPGSYTRAMGAVNEHERTMNQTVNNSLTQYNDELDTVERNARQTILTNLLLGLVPGLVVGGVGGAAVIYRLGESAQFFRDYGGGDYGSKQLYGLVGAGIVLVVLGVASIVVTGLWRAIL